MTFLSIMRKVTITVAAAGTLAFAAAGVAGAETSAPAQVVPQSSELVAQVHRGGESQIGPFGTNECTDHLANFGYKVTNLRFAICLAAAVVGTPSAAAVCTGALVTTGVDAIVAGGACLLAILPTVAPSSARPV